jgi:hypothetical protein
MIFVTFLNHTPAQTSLSPPPLSHQLMHTQSKIMKVWDSFPQNLTSLCIVSNSCILLAFSPTSPSPLRAIVQTTYTVFPLSTLKWPAVHLLKCPFLYHLPPVLFLFLTLSKPVFLFLITGLCSLSPKDIALSDYWIFALFHH